MKLIVPPPFIALACLVLMWVTAKYFPNLSFDFPLRVLLALVVCIAGGIINIVAVSHFVRNKTTISPVTPQKTEALVITGMYTFTRNPMYLGMVLLIIAIGLWLGNAMMIPAVVLFVWYITQFQIKPEEEALREKFGAPYEEYCKKVRRWI